MSAFRWLSWIVWFGATLGIVASWLDLLSVRSGWIAFGIGTLPTVIGWIHSQYVKHVVIPRDTSQIDAATAYLEAGEYDAAERLYREVLQRRSPMNKYAAALLGKAIHEAGRHEEAHDLLEDAVSDVRDGLLRGWTITDILYYRAVNRAWLNDFDGAVKDFDEAIEHGGRNAFTLSRRGNALLQLGRYREAAVDLDEADRLKPGELITVRSLAVILAACPLDDLRDGAAAVEYARRACVQTDWTDWQALSVLAAAYAETGNWREAVRFARGALDTAPEEERDERRERLKQFELQIPFRLPAPSDASETTT